MSLAESKDPKIAALDTQISKIINLDCGRNKDQFVSYVQNTLFQQGASLMSPRQPLEQKVSSNPADTQAWNAYINFELDQGEKQRANALYKRALSSCLAMQTSVNFWAKYVTFLYTTMKAEQGITEARIIFETKLEDADSQFLSSGDKVAFLLEKARFEEVTGSALKARKIYEQLTTDIAPGLI